MSRRKEAAGPIPGIRAGAWLVAVLLAPGLGGSAEGAFAYRKPLTIQGARVSGAPHASFPVLISLVDPNLRTIANGGRVHSASGYDIAFMLQSTGALLDHEIENYNGTTGAVVAWVRIPSLTAANQTIVLYYGDPEIGCTPGTPANVWDPNHVAVWHLNDSMIDEAVGGVHPDSTANGRDGIQNRNTNAPGKIARGQDFDGTNDFIGLGTGFTALGATFTIEGWVWFDSLASLPVLFAREDNTNLDYRIVYDNGCGANRLRVDISYDGTEPGDAQACANAPTGTGQWHHFAATKSTTQLTFFLNGVAGTPTATAGTVNQNPGIQTRMALRQDNSQDLDGRLDEVRVSSVDRSAGWIQTSFNNQDCPSTSTCGAAANRFVVEGAEEAVPTNYRSIGDTSAPYSAGSLTAVNGSATVLGTGTAWRTANRGRGDTISFGAFTGTILSVDAEDRLTLVSPSTVGGAFPVYSINRKFADLASWEDCIDGGSSPCGPDPAIASADLVAGDRREVGIVYKDKVYVDTVVDAQFDVLVIDGSTTGPFHTITLTADPGNRHNGIPGSGVVLDLGGAADGNGVFLADNFATVEWMEVRNAVSAADGIQIAAVNGANRRVVRNCILHDTGSRGIQIHTNANTYDIEVYNNFVYGVSRGIYVEDALLATSTVRILNNTVFSCTSASGAGISGVAPSGGTPVTVSNNISHSNAGGSFGILGLDPASRNNLASDLTGIAHSPAGGGQDSVPLTGAGGVNFVDTTVGSENLHLRTSAPLSAAQDTGADMSCFLRRDIDGVARLSPWEIGADDVSQLTAVTLQSFSASGADGAVELSWTTASELQNLGFHLHRASSAEGPFERITSSLIPGLGSSPVGATYSYRDPGLVNGQTYYYRLEDVEATGRTTPHGPVWAVAGTPGGGEGCNCGSGDGGGSDPTGSGEAGAGGSDGSVAGAATPPSLPACSAPPSSLPCRETHGDPTEVSVRVVKRTPRALVLELRTAGFEAIREADGRVWVRISGFEDPEDPHAPALPFKRVMVPAPVGRTARVTWVKERGVESHAGLVPSAAGYRDMDVRADGTVRPGRRAARLRDVGGLLPRRLARLGEPSFVGERKQVPVDLFPLRFDASRGAVRLARRLLVRVDFSGREARERGEGSRGRRAPRRRPGGGETLAFLHVTDKGLHAVPFEALFPRRTRALSLEALSLQRRGEGVAFHVEPSRREFGPGSILYFYAEAGPESTSYGPEVSYELVRAPGGTQMQPVGAAPRGDVLATASLAPASRETNRIYQAGLLEAEDPWQWENLPGGVSKTKGFALTGADVSSARGGRLRVWLQGASDVEDAMDHHVEVLLNGTWVGETVFDGKRPHRLEAEVPASAFREGPNDLTVRNVGDTGAYSLVFLDRFEVDYPQASALRRGTFEGEWDGAGIAQVALPEPGGPPLAAVDVTDPAHPRWLVGLEPGPGSVRLRVESGHHYVLASPEGVLAPRVFAPVSSSLKSPSNRADYILIAPQAFMAAAQPLLGRRGSQGLRTLAASLEEIASLFGHGEASGEAIRAFLTHAYHEWRRPSPRYVVLLGDASHDPRNFIGTSAPAPLPALFLKTTYLVTASDPALVAVNGDDPLPDLAIGRLPAQTVEEAQSLIEKLLAWEDSGQGLGGKAVLVADDPDEAGDFEWDVADIRDSFLADHDAQTILLRREGPGTREKILEAFDAGASFMSYAGHGGAAVWASENVLNSWDVTSLLAQSAQPVMLTLNCLNGYFVAPAFDSLGEAYLKAQGRGTIAAFSPSGLSMDGPAHELHRALMRELKSGRHQRLGDAVLAAQESYAQTGLMPELLSIYHLLGDPGTTIR